MKLKIFSSIVSLAGICLVTSCKDSTKTSTGDSNGGSAAVAPVDAGYILYSSTLPPVGFVKIETETMSMKDMTMKMDMQGKQINGTMNRTMEKIKTTTVDNASQVTVLISKDESEGSMVMNGNPMPQPKETGDLVSAAVILTKGVDGKWISKLKEGEATPDQRKELDRMAGGKNDPDERHILGTEPRKVGDTWDVDVKKLSSFAGPDSRDLDGTFKIKFESIEEHEGQKCAVLVADVNINGKTEDGMTINMTGTLKVLQSLEYHTAMSMSMNGMMTLNGELQGGAGTMKVEGPMKVESRTTFKLP